MKNGLLDFLQSASNMVAGNVAGPVDLLGMGLNKIGVPVGSAPVGGSEWMKSKGLMRDVQPGAARVLGETAGLLGPAMATQFAPQIAKGLLQAGDNLAAPVAMNKQAGKVLVGPQSEALETAQKNATEMLGLPPNNTAADRAKALGFTDDVYHGSNRVFDKFSTKGAGKTTDSGAFVTDNPHLASTYSATEGGHVMPLLLRNEAPVVVAANGQNWNYIKPNTKITAPKVTVSNNSDDALWEALTGEKSTTAVTKKAFSKTVKKLFPDSFKYDDAVSTDDLARWANSEGYSAMLFNGVKDRGPVGTFHTEMAGLPSNNTAVFDPSRLRSRFAAFDPARIKEADLLGRADPRLLGLLGIGVGGGAYMMSDK